MSVDALTDTTKRENPKQMSQQATTVLHFLTDQTLINITDRGDYRSKTSNHHHHHHSLPLTQMLPHLSAQDSTSKRIKVDPRVFGKVRLCLEALPTKVTLELPQPSVSNYVVTEGGTGWKSFPTLLTRIVSFTSVSHGVCGKGRLLSEPFPTHLALIIFYITVCQSVLGER